MGAKIIDKLPVDLKKAFPQVKGFSPRNLLYLKQFAESYPISVLQQFIEIEKELKSMAPISQQAVAKLLSFENAPNESTVQPIPTSMEETFLQFIVAKITWSHHIVLKNKVQHLGKHFCFMLLCTFTSSPLIPSV